MGGRLLGLVTQRDIDFIGPSLLQTPVSKVRVSLVCRAAAVFSILLCAAAAAALTAAGLLLLLRCV